MPEIEWKDGARCAALITVNLDAENFWLAVDPDVSKRPKTLSMGQYGMDRGLPRLLELLDDLDIKATFFVPGSTAAAYAEKVKDVAARGHEIALRGYELLNWGLLPAEQAAADMEKGAAVLKNVVGAQPRGYRAPIAEFTLDTLRARPCQRRRVFQQPQQRRPPLLVRPGKRRKTAGDPRSLGPLRPAVLRLQLPPAHAEGTGADRQLRSGLQ